MNGDAQSLHELLRAGANVSAPCSRDNPQTSIGFASANGYTPIVRDLLDAGACVNDISSGHTPLMHAARGGHSSTVRPVREPEIRGWYAMKTGIAVSKVRSSNHYPAGWSYAKDVEALIGAFVSALA
jgi:hypothetical protein